MRCFKLMCEWIEFRSSTSSSNSSQSMPAASSSSGGVECYRMEASLEKKLAAPPMRKSLSNDCPPPSLDPRLSRFSCNRGYRVVYQREECHAECHSISNKWPANLEQFHHEPQVNGSSNIRKGWLLWSDVINRISFHHRLDSLFR